MVQIDNSDNASSRQLTELADMADHEFREWCRLLANRTGLQFDASRRAFLCSNLRMRMRELNIASYHDYYRLLQQGHLGAAELTTLIDRLTVHETRFFRHPSSLALITEAFLPDYLARQPTPVSLSAWSVGCSTGEEAYSLGITLDQYLRARHPEYYLAITASDISLASLAEARRGIYSQRRLKGVSEAQLQHYFTPSGSAGYQVKALLRQRICFNHLNILEVDTAPIDQMDIIICQNLLIYYQRTVRHRILNQLAARLRPGGLLLLGSGEALCWQNPELTRLTYPDTLAYLRRSDCAKEADHV